MSIRKLAAVPILKDEYSQPPCLNISKLKKKSKLNLSLMKCDNRSKTNQSLNASDLSGCSEMAVISFGCDKSPDSKFENEGNRPKGNGDSEESHKNRRYYCKEKSRTIEARSLKIDQETQTDPSTPRKVSNRKIAAIFVLLFVFFCSSGIDRYNLIDMLKGLHQEYLSRPDSTEFYLLDGCTENGKLPQLKDMVQLQAKVESLEKALVKLRQSENMPSTRAADKMLEFLYGPIPDYALESTGGSILETPNTESYSSSGIISIFGLNFGKQINSNPRIIIQGLITPGECWTFKGTVGSVVIQLSRHIRVSSVTLEHFPEYLLPAGSSSLSVPKIFTVMALPDCETSNCQVIHLGLFEYNLFGPARQTFLISREIFESMPTAKIIELHFTANHGNPMYTCVYRVRIHGEPEHNLV